MVHHTIIPLSPERMRRLTLSLICSSSKAANLLKPTSFGISSSQIRTSLVSPGYDLCHPTRAENQGAEDLCVIQSYASAAELGEAWPDHRS